MKGLAAVRVVTKITDIVTTMPTHCPQPAPHLTSFQLFEVAG